MVPDRIEGCAMAHLTGLLQSKKIMAGGEASFARFWLQDMRNLHIRKHIAQSFQDSLYIIPGYYTYLEASNQQQGHKARLGTKVIDKFSSNCRLRFWLNMRGDHIGRLNVYKRTSYNDPK